MPPSQSSDDMHIGRATTSVTRQTLKRQSVNKSAQRALRWGLLNLVLAVFCIFELCFSSNLAFFGWEHTVGWYVLCTLAVIFSINFIVDLCRYLIPTLQGIRYPIHISAYERDLLGVTDNAVGFKTVDPRHRVPSAPASLRTTPVKASIKPSNTYIYSTPPSFRPGFYGSPGGSRGSPGSQPITPQRGLAMNMSSSMPYQTPSPLNQSNSPFTPRDVRGSGSGSLLRSRHQSSPVNRSPLTAEETIADMGALNNYLKAQDDRRAVIDSTESSPGGSPSFFAYNRSASDFTYLLGRQQYQLASRSPQSPSMRKDDDPDYPAKYGASESWTKVDVNREELERWTGNLRNWLSQAIFAPVVKQIRQLNGQLHTVGHGEVQIGESSIASLKLVAVMKSGQLPTLNQLIPYLDLSSNQEYVVQRIKDLGEGGYINEFRWDKGGDYKGRKWDKDLPSDCELVMHMFCTFMDSQLPPDPKYPNGKTFTSCYFMKTPDKPVTYGPYRGKGGGELPSDPKYPDGQAFTSGYFMNFMKTPGKPRLNLKKDNILMFQTKVTPPHYKVIIKDDTWDVSKGRNNMFHTILFFLHHIRSKHYGMLGRVNLGPAGVNILSIIKDDLQKLIE